MLRLKPESRDTLLSLFERARGAVDLEERAARTKPTRPLWRDSRVRVVVFHSSNPNVRKRLVVCDLNDLKNKAFKALKSKKGLRKKPNRVVLASTNEVVDVAYGVLENDSVLKVFFEEEEEEEEEEDVEVASPALASSPFVRPATRRKFPPRAIDASELPVSRFKSKIVSEIEAHAVTVVVSETGSGKTTQIPQFLCETYENARVICTQPRRIAATSVARRVAAERGQKVGESVGYSVRNDRKTSSETVLEFVTLGVLLRRLAFDAGFSRRCTHLVIDEVHERTIESDMLLCLLKEMPNAPKVVLMSASINADSFVEYFNDDSVKIEVPGRAFEVESVFLDELLTEWGSARAALPCNGNSNSRFTKKDQLKRDCTNSEWRARDVDYLNASKHAKKYLQLSNYDSTIRPELCVETLKDVPENATVLVFVPGKKDADSVKRAVKKEFPNREVMELHGNSSVEAANKALSSDAPKIVVATNVAETSITVPEVSTVIDFGRRKQMRVVNGMGELKTTSCSRSSVFQRKGRAGRTQKGKCFHLYARHDFEACMRDYDEPEISRAPLDEAVLLYESLDGKKSSAADFFSKAIEPPSFEKLSRAIRSLQEAGALNYEGNATDLGKLLASLPVNVKEGKTLIWGAILGVAKDASLMATSMDDDSFLLKDSPLKEKSDFDAAWEAWEAFRQGRRACESLRLNFFKMRVAFKNAKELEKLALKAVDVAQSNDLSLQSRKRLVRCALTGGLFPNVAYKATNDSLKIDSKTFVKAKNLNSSLCVYSKTLSFGPRRVPILSFAVPTSPVALTLFSSFRVVFRSNKIEVSPEISFECSRNDIQSFEKLRLLLAHVLHNPKDSLSKDVISVVRSLLG